MFWGFRTSREDKKRLRVPAAKVRCRLLCCDRGGSSGSCADLTPAGVISHPCHFFPYSAGDHYRGHFYSGLLFDSRIFPTSKTCRSATCVATVLNNLPLHAWHAAWMVRSLQGIIGHLYAMCAATLPLSIGGENWRLLPMLCSLPLH